MRRPHGLLCRFWARPMHIRLLLVEALVSLTLASCLIRFLPFRVVVRTAEWPLKGSPPAPVPRRAMCNQVQWAVQTWARHVPWRALCFQQGLAVQWMLRRRHIPSVLYYGAATSEERGVVAHVWVCDGAVAVIGGEAAVDVAVLARFPEPVAD